MVKARLAGAGAPKPPGGRVKYDTQGVGHSAVRLPWHGARPGRWAGLRRASAANQFGALSRPLALEFPGGLRSCLALRFGTPPGTACFSPERPGCRPGRVARSNARRAAVCVRPAAGPGMSGIRVRVRQGIDPRLNVGLLPSDAVWTQPQRLRKRAVRDSPSDRPSAGSVPAHRR